MIRPVPMMQTARSLASAALVAAALAAPSARAQDAASPARFRLFPEAPPSADPKPAGAARAQKPEKRFWRAAGVLLGEEVVSWTFDRYVADQDYAHISWETVRNNLQSGFTIDSDKFMTNQLGHSIGGITRDTRSYRCAVARATSGV